jgi:predicted dehydrogenase
MGIGEMSKTYKVVVVGMGKRGKHHASAFHANDRFEVAGICDIQQSLLDDVASDLGNPETGTDAGALAASVKPDIFCFCTLPGLRMDMIKVGVESGASLIAFEKPIATSSAEAMKIRKLLADSGTKAVVSHQHRYGQHYRKVREIAASGALGNIHTVYASATGWMMHMMTHMIDYMRWYNGNEDAEWAIGQAAGRGKMDDNHPSPDYVSGMIQFANGVRGIVETGAGAPDIPEVGKWWGRNRIRVMGDKGFAEVLTNGGWRSVTESGAESGEGAMNYDADMPPYVQEMADWLDDDTRLHQCNFESAYKGFEIMMAICRSAAEGGQVALPLVEPLDELSMLREKVSDAPVILGSPEHAAEY